MKLHELADNPGAVKKRMRIGRGPGSGKGKTGGVGIKGQKARAGVAVAGFEGGQNPLFRRLPKRGFRNTKFAKRFAVINLGILQKFIDAGRLDATQPVTEDALVASGLVRRRLNGVRLLAKGEVTSAVELHLAGASAAAIAAIEARGGKVVLPAAPAATE